MNLHSYMQPMNKTTVVIIGLHWFKTITNIKYEKPSFYISHHATLFCRV